MMFEIGDKVKCIDADWCDWGNLECPLELGAVYTVEEVVASPSSGIGCGGKFLGKGEALLVLVEVTSPWTHPDGLPYGFDPRRFRKLPNISESLEAVKELFNKRPSEAEARELMKDFMKGVE